MQTNEHFDVVIMGGGYAGNVQARHLLRKIPGIKIAVIDPRSDEKVASIHKIGESTVEIGAIFLSKELGLVDYMIENHLPKCGLAFHWPRAPAKTDTIDDYYAPCLPPRRAGDAVTAVTHWTLPAVELGKGQFGTVINAMQEASFAPGDDIITEGADASAPDSRFFVLQSGAVDIVKEVDGEVTVLWPLGYLTARPSLQRLHRLAEVVEKETEAGARRIVIDLRYLRAVVAPALYPLVIAAERLRAAGGKLVLCGANHNVAPILQLLERDSGSTQGLVIHGTQQEATSSTRADLDPGSTS